MKYKGYTASVEYDHEDDILVGKVVGINDTIVFHGESTRELKQAFTVSIDDYLQACEQLGQEPGKPYSGKIALRVPVDLHAKIAVRAKREGASVNKFISRTLEERLA